MECIAKLTNNYRSDSITHAINLDDVYVREYGNDHLANGIQVIRKLLEIKGCKRDAQKVGIIPGSSNNPVKRWSVRNWVALITKFIVVRPNTKIYLYGTQEDLPVANAIASGVNPKKIVNMAGKTDLREFPGGLGNRCKHKREKKTMQPGIIRNWRVLPLKGPLKGYQDLGWRTAHLGPPETSLVPEGTVAD